MQLSPHLGRTKWTRDIQHVVRYQEENEGKLKTYEDHFESHVNPKANPVFARYKFHNKIQGPTEPVEQFITELQLLAQDCKLHDNNEMVRDKIVFGTNSSKVRAKLILEGVKLALDKAIQIARNYETSQAQLKSMSAVNREEHIHSLKQQTQHESNKKETTAQSHPRQTAPQCGNCGRWHYRSDKCPAKGQVCHHCKKPNHFAQVCKSKGRRTQIHSIDNRDNDHSMSQFESITFESLVIAKINQNKPKPRKDEVFATVGIHLNAKPKSQIKASLKYPANTSHKAKIDTGAQGNILPITLYRMMFPQSIDKDGNPK